MPKRSRRGRAAAQREANFLCLFRRYKKSARKRGHSFSLTVDRFRELVTSPCLICGVKPSQRYRHDSSPYYKTPFIYNGIDRLNNHRGYVEGNVAPCCSECNYAKGSRSLEQLLLYIYRAYHHAILPALNEGTPDEFETE